MRNFLQIVFVSLLLVPFSNGAWAYPAQISKVESPNGNIQIQIMIEE